MIRKTLLTLTTTVSLLTVLTEPEIRNARHLGAKWYHQHGDYFNIASLAKSSAQQTFPHNELKQHEWALELSIGWMMASEAALWEPKQGSAKS
jgi:hypothetical protein